LRLSQRQPTILEGESSETSGQGRDERHWLPGCCGLLPYCSTEQERVAGGRSGCGCAVAWPSGSATGFGKCGTRRSLGAWALSGRSGHSAAQRWQRQIRKPRTMRSRWLASAAFVLGGCFLGADWDRRFEMRSRRNPQHSKSLPSTSSGRAISGTEPA